MKKKKYRVLIVRYGWMEVEAESPAAAIDYVDHAVPTSEVNWSDDWTPTDADEIEDEE